MQNDQLSKDVLEVETLLRREAPKIEFWQAVELESDCAPDIETEIGWAEYGRFRLLFRRTKFDENDDVLSEEKMLLGDAPTALLEELHDFLPLFMEELASHLKTLADEPQENSEDSDGN
ncbi:MAG: hypothetical protein ABIR96_11995 [Bdellovibrionota bacterium]